ncbi:PREDICTED: uncharacterized protein LOC102027777 isoform X2 [Chinchilla lanigera]|uniref:uncharacterized protein LOC102027777 isoform X2 n=1 Tax=Chinchilla lanigera TaxID=34839 RepID=UPI000697130D|nr:PREDICTED: uncharacterized protein LOC102027777 isoform X2 [Chinchilla lanigera]
MQLLLLAAGLSLLSMAPAEEGDMVMPASRSTLLGTWYILRWAGTIPIPREKRREPLPPFSFVVNYIGKLEFRMHIRKPSGCHLFKLPFNEGLDPGSFITWWKHLIHIWLLTPRTYGVAFFDDKINNQMMSLVMLFVRSTWTPVVTPSSSSTLLTSPCCPTYLKRPPLPVPTSCLCGRPPASQFSCALGHRCLDLRWAPRLAPCCSVCGPHLGGPHPGRRPAGAGAVH